MQKELEVKNLRISFKTNNGTVKAVRGISFDLYKGETLAIVGESGSGKSVTSRAILGILAPNKIVEGGEIVYDGKDLLKITEEDFYQIRGTKISMIFQDPMSSLNPIMKVGKQLTEAMLLKGSANQKDAKKTLFEKLSLLEKNILLERAGNITKEEEKNIQQLFETFSSIAMISGKEEMEYNDTYEKLKFGRSIIEELLVSIKVMQFKSVYSQIKELINELMSLKNIYLLDSNSEIFILLSKLKNSLKKYKKNKDYKIFIPFLENIKIIIDKSLNIVRPNFLAICFAKENGLNISIREEGLIAINNKCEKYLDNNFLNEFKSIAKIGVSHSYKETLKNQEKVIEYINANLDIFMNSFDESMINSKLAELKNLLINSINYLLVRKNSVAYTFITSIKSAYQTYFYGGVNNPKEEARFSKEKARNLRLKEKGKAIEKIVPPIHIDLELVKENIRNIFHSLINEYQDNLLNITNFNIDKEIDELINYLFKQASLSVYNVTKVMAKNRAIELLKEVGIADPRKRYNQYPFEFSGGMRQRIVIAIALASNPDVLICDEPTTALDVTIQSQILELINRLKEERKLSIIFITHDLGVVANIADRIAVMYAGKIVEYGKVDEIFYNPKHPYTWALLSSMPDLDTKEKLEAIPGTPPNMIYPPKGDAFAARNKYALKIDFEEEPPLFKVTPTHFAATWLLHKCAPNVNPPRIVLDRIERMKKIGGSDDE